MLDQITARLKAALPKAVPVLQPHEVLMPAQWQEETPDGEIRPGGERGLHVYLRQKAPQGYVQLYHDRTNLKLNLTDVGQVQVDVYASTAALASALANAVRADLDGTPTHPTPFQFASRTTDEQADFTRVVLTFETRAIGV
ncbi:hypothetical protein GCM10008956_39030 [Deinococcus arenae]|uniref:DUF3168 domain-containing protein n=1 Tax=Deinococcus arenae TaxID=1452751 RepID=A0A8H9GSQ9_9DEIO|nr:hypothetical protein [Deinococcus arenae]GGM59565.1 hypothetical protein GCM10008956_39030 [Deinococcus arenae]